MLFWKRPRDVKITIVEVEKPDYEVAPYLCIWVSSSKSNGLLNGFGRYVLTKMF